MTAAIHATLPWAYHCHVRGWEGRGTMQETDPRVCVCVDWCWLPPGSCERDPRCPFKGNSGRPLPAAEALRRAKWVLEVGWID